MGSATPTPVCDGLDDARVKTISVPQEDKLNHDIRVKVRNSGAPPVGCTMQIGIYADITPPGGPTNPFGCTPTGRLIQTSATVAPGNQFQALSGVYNFSCSAATGGGSYVIVAVADAHADDLASCGPGQLQSMSCFNALADDDAIDANNRMMQTCCPQP